MPLCFLNTFRGTEGLLPSTLHTDSNIKNWEHKVENTLQKSQEISDICIQHRFVSFFCPDKGSVCPTSLGGVCDSSLSADVIDA